MEKLHAVCAVIREEGVSDGAAGARAGVAHTTLSRWKTQYEEAELELAKARALYELPRLQKIAQVRRKNGTLDWRAQAWLVKFAAPEEYGRPSRRRRLRGMVISEKEATAETIHSTAICSAPAPVCEIKSVTFSPETPGATSTAQLAKADDAESVTLSPEIRLPADLCDANAAKDVAFSPEMTAVGRHGANAARRSPGLACVWAFGPPESAPPAKLAA
jgi:hypothetical protein